MARRNIILDRAALVGVAVCTALAVSEARAQACSRADFETVVTQASTTLRDMTGRNTPTFQARLRELKEKRGWTYEQFVKEAAPLVDDDKIGEFDNRSMGLLEKINALGGEGASGAKPDCRLLDTLKTIMAELVETQTQKWAYMFGKLDAEMEK